VRELRYKACSRDLICVHSIVAIHGQGGHRINSFTDGDTTLFWLKDLLPKVIPRARVFSFGYGPRTSVIDIVNQLIEGLCKVRVGQLEVERQILWIAHSFGGLLVKAVRIFSSSPP
jgi:hypothetical protein